MEITGHLRLDDLLESLVFESSSLRYVADEYEIETTDGEYIFVDLDIHADSKYHYQDNSRELLSADVDVEVHYEYFSTGKDGEELELNMSDEQATSIEKEIKKSILDKLGY